MVALFFLFRGGLAHGSTDDDNFRQDVIECEQASAHLRDCCPDAQSMPDCHYLDKTTTVDCGCGDSYSTTSTDRPIAIEDSKSIQNSSCDDLRDQGACERTWESNAQTSSDGSGCNDEEDAY